MSFEEFELTDADVPAVIATCTKLRRPAACHRAFCCGCIGPFGIHELAKRLDDRFTLLAQGRRNGAAASQDPEGDARLELRNSSGT